MSLGNGGQLLEHLTRGGSGPWVQGQHGADQGVEHPIAGVRGGDLVVTIDNSQLVAVIERVFVEAKRVKNQSGGPDINGL